MSGINWQKTYKNPIGDIRRGKGSTSVYGSMREAFAKGQEQLAEQEKANAMLRKALPVMENILLQRMVSRSPITLVRPMGYTVEVMRGGSDEPTQDEDDGFYALNKGGSGGKFNAKFESITKVLPAGTVLTFVNLEKSMNQMWFKTQEGEEVGIYVDEKARLMVQSDICDLVQAHFAEQE